VASPTYDRDSVEFSRTLSFTDGLFAIAITLLVIDLAVPVLHHDSSIHELADRLNDEKEKFISFFISFAVIGRYWIAHHTFFSQLARMDRPLIALNLLYLAFIAFLPFPTALLGEYFSNPLSIVIYAVTVAIISGMEVVLFSRAQNHGLLEKKLPSDVDPGRLRLDAAGRLLLVPRHSALRHRRAVEARGRRRAVAGLELEYARIP
jgi:uncharacterized membrane protein